MRSLENFSLEEITRETEDVKVEKEAELLQKQGLIRKEKIKEENIKKEDHNEEAFREEYIREDDISAEDIREDHQRKSRRRRAEARNKDNCEFSMESPGMIFMYGATLVLVVLAIFGVYIAKRKT